MLPCGLSEPEGTKLLLFLRKLHTQVAMRTERMKRRHRKRKQTATDSPITAESRLQPVRMGGGEVQVYTCTCTCRFMHAQVLCKNTQHCTCTYLNLSLKDLLIAMYVCVCVLNNVTYNYTVLCICINDRNSEVYLPQPQSS